MHPSTTEMPRHWIFVHRFNYLETQISHLHDYHFCSSSELCSGDQRRRRQRRFHRQQMCLRNGSSLPLPRHTYSPLHRLDGRSDSEVSYILSHTFAQSLKSVLQEELQVLSYMVLNSRGFSRVSEADAGTDEDIDNYATNHREEHVSAPFSHRVQCYPCCNFDSSWGEVPFRWLLFSLLSPQPSLQRIMPVLNYRDFSGVSIGKTETVEEIEQTWDDDESKNKSGESQADGGISVADVKEVESVCKVIEELFASDRNVEAVLDQRGIDLSRDLVLDVLARFRHDWKSAFWFFFWVGRRSGFLYHSRTYDSMMGVPGKTRQFESMVAMLEEMRNKGFPTIKTLSIAIWAIAASERPLSACLMALEGQSLEKKLKLSLRRFDPHHSPIQSPCWMVRSEEISRGSKFEASVRCVCMVV